MKMTIKLDARGGDLVKRIVRGAAELRAATGLRPTILTVGAEVDAALTPEQRIEIYELAHVIVEAKDGDVARPNPPGR